MPAGPRRLPGRQGLAKQSGEKTCYRLRSTVPAARLRHRTRFVCSAQIPPHSAATAGCKQVARPTSTWRLCYHGLWPVKRLFTKDCRLSAPGARLRAGSLPGRESPQTVSAQGSSLRVVFYGFPHWPSTAAPARAISSSSSTVPPLTPTAPTMVPVLSTKSTPPAKMISPSLLTSMP